MRKFLLVLLFLLTPLLAFGEVITITYTYPTDTTIEGFKFYDNQVQFCEEVDPATREITCPITLTSGGHIITMTAFEGTEESAHSVGFPFITAIIIPGISGVQVR